MNQAIDVNLEQQIVLLNAQNLAELRLFVEFLLTRQQKSKQRKFTQKRILSDLETLAMPVDHVILDRETLYDHRI